MNLVVVLVAVVATLLAGVRWLRVAQREHYLAGSASRFARRWWGLGPNRLLALAAGLGAVLSFVAPASGPVGVAAVAVGPFGLGLRGRTSKLAWTRRLRTLAGVWAALQATFLVAGALAGLVVPAAVLGALSVPLAVDAACALTAPLERRLAGRFVDAATAKLRRIAPVVVGITGSYGKTGTKGYVAHLISGARSVVASPASYNNRAGLARAINEHLAPGTEVFVAEMGTYGRGEIADLCAWVRPTIGVITAVGPVHLERFGDEDRIAEAKAEILATAEVAVLNVDDPRLDRLAQRLLAEDRRVLRCSATDPTADVFVGPRGDGRSQVHVRGEAIGSSPPAIPPTNLGCSVAVAVELGVPKEAVARALPTLPTAPHRLSIATGASGATVIDDTYNSNPAGCRAALELLARHAVDGGRRVVVTPGMVELGPRQHDENVAFAAEAARRATHLVVVGYSNRRALLEGAEQGAVQVVLAESRGQAVGWVREQAAPGDVVLYENDLPDHFP